MSRTPAEILDAIADEIEADPTRWTQGEYARNRDGQPVDVKSGVATCWCAFGFIMRDGEPLGGAAWSYLAKAMPNGAIFNDARGTTAAHIAERFRKAAELARAAS